MKPNLISSTRLRFCEDSNCLLPSPVWSGLTLSDCPCHSLPFSFLPLSLLCCPSQFNSGAPCRKSYCLFRSFWVYLYLTNEILSGIAHVSSFWLLVYFSTNFAFLLDSEVPNRHCQCKYPDWQWSCYLTDCVDDIPPQSPESLIHYKEQVMARRHTKTELPYISLTNTGMLKLCGNIT